MKAWFENKYATRLSGRSHVSKYILANSKTVVPQLPLHTLPMAIHIALCLKVCPSTQQELELTNDVVEPPPRAPGQQVQPIVQPSNSMGRGGNPGYRGNPMGGGARGGMMRGGMVNMPMGGMGMGMGIPPNMMPNMMGGFNNFNGGMRGGGNAGRGMGMRGGMGTSF